MPHDVISTCPVCANDLASPGSIARAAGRASTGSSASAGSGGSDRDQLALLESFLRSRGNLREMERELGLSYPTVRSRVDGLVRALGLGDGPAPSADGDDASPDGPDPSPGELTAARQSILERLSRREIDAATAAIEIRALRRTEP